MTDYQRSVEDAVYSNVYPSEGLGSDPLSSLRHQAIVEVLRRIPAEDFAKLEELADAFQWLVPDIRMRAGVHPFPAHQFTPEELGMPAREGIEIAPMAKVLWLCPTLEHAAWDVVVGIVAHELAHIVLKHHIFTSEEYERQEQEAWDCIRKWGFITEARKVLAVNKWRESWEQSYVKKLMAKG